MQPASLALYLITCFLPATAIAAAEDPCKLTPVEVLGSVQMTEDQPADDKAEIDSNITIPLDDAAKAARNWYVQAEQGTIPGQEFKVLNSRFCFKERVFVAEVRQGCGVYSMRYKLRTHIHHASMHIEAKDMRVGDNHQPAGRTEMAKLDSCFRPVLAALQGSVPKVDQPTNGFLLRHCLPGGDGKCADPKWTENY